MYKYATPENTAVNCKSKGEFGIHPGVWKWAEVEAWLAEGNTIEPFETDQEKHDKALRDINNNLNQEKKKAKSEGIQVDGILFDTDSEARIAYLELMVKFMIDPTYTVQDWKASEGSWVVMDITLFNKLVAAWEQRLSSLFSFIKTKETEIKSKNTKEELESVNVKFVND